MKIACIIHSLDGGGAERVMAGLASRLVERGHQVTLVTLDDGLNDRHPLHRQVERCPLGLMKPTRRWVEKLRMTRLRMQAVGAAVRSARCEVVLSFCDRTNILVLQSLGSSGLPVVVSERSDPVQQQLGWFWEQQRRRAYPHADRIVALTDASAEALQSLSPHPVVTIPSAVELPPRQADRPQAIANQRIVGVGRLEFEKGFDRLIQAVARATDSDSPWRLRILGCGSQQETLRQLAANAGIGSRVELAGWIQPVWDELAQATMFVLPSRYEGFPSALLEAMALGVPSLAVDCESGPRVIIDHSSNGLLVDNSIAGLSSGIEQLIEQPDLREQLGAAGKEVVERFGWEAMVDRYEQVLREAIASHRP